MNDENVIRAAWQVRDDLLARAEQLRRLDKKTGAWSFDRAAHAATYLSNTSFFVQLAAKLSEQAADD